MTSVRIDMDELARMHLRTVQGICVAHIEGAPELYRDLEGRDVLVVGFQMHLGLLHAVVLDTERSETTLDFRMPGPDGKPDFNHPRGTIHPEALPPLKPLRVSRYSR